MYSFAKVYDARKEVPLHYFRCNEKTNRKQASRDIVFNFEGSSLFLSIIPFKIIKLYACTFNMQSLKLGYDSRRTLLCIRAKGDDDKHAGDSATGIYLPSSSDPSLKVSSFTTRSRLLGTTLVEWALLTTSSCEILSDVCSSGLSAMENRCGSGDNPSGLLRKHKANAKIKVKL